MTKYRRGVLDAAMLRSGQDAMRKARGDFGAELRAFGCQDDHVHLLVAYPLRGAVPALVNSLRGVPARRAEFTGRVNRHTTHGHLWPPPYVAVSCGGAPRSIIRTCIRQQRRPVNGTSGLTPP